jgi:hypothetical protein
MLPGSILSEHRMITILTEQRTSTTFPAVVTLKEGAEKWPHEEKQMASL